MRQRKKIFQREPYETPFLFHYNRESFQDDFCTDIEIEKNTFFCFYNKDEKKK